MPSFKNSPRGVLSDNQYGFCAGYSTQDALHDQDDQQLVPSSWDHNLLTACIFLDVKKALGSVDHCALLKRLSTISCGNSSLHWFSVFLSNRKQCVKLGNLSLKFGSKLVSHKAAN